MRETILLSLKCDQLLCVCDGNICLSLSPQSEKVLPSLICVRGDVFSPV